MLRDGYAVGFCGRDARLGYELQGELAHLGPAKFVRADVGAERDVEAFIAACAHELGPPTVLVNNAGRNANFDATTMTEADWDAFFAVDLKSAWLCAKHTLPHMRASGGGAIVNVSSIHASATLEGFFPYAAAKAGLAGLTRSLALDHGPDGIRVNCLCPGFTDTRLVRESMERAEDPAAAERAMVAGVALGRIAAPEEIAATIAFLASPEASYITGATLYVDGGLTARRAG
ncbi:SDR family oxidoreductase [Solirubrobacter phytolaccae]|uniref:SDR family oxidoreductase n=1 Tax=Solirubrobacter phytolaccae TaxID=1404360 RepID=A0A9X3NG77_9ACTN|nr:SDR family oxidoreductase [Solirubrobacter phytolaccae]